MIVAAALDSSDYQIDLAHEGSIELGELHLEPALRRISAFGRERILEPKVMQVLVALAREPGTIFSHDDLIDHCWNGATIGDGSVNRVISLLRKALEEVVGNSVRIETLPKVGYRLLVTENDLSPADEEASKRSWRTWHLRHHLKLLVAMGIGILLALLAWLAGSGAARSDQTVAVLPTQSQGEVDPFLAAGMDAELHDLLVRSKGLTIFGEVSTRTLVRAGLEPRQIGERLGADYVVENTLRREGETIRITSNLMPVGSEGSRWKGELSSGEDAVVSLPARLTRELLLALGRDPVSYTGVEIKDELDRRLYLTAYGMIHSRNQEQIASAYQILDPLKDRYPRSAKIHSLVAKALFFGRQMTLDNLLNTPGQALAHARKALALDPNSVEALKTAGILETDPDVRMRLLERAVRLAPTDAEAWLWLSNERVRHAQAMPSLEAIRQAALLDPMWNRSWQAPDAFAGFGLIEEADALDRLIMAASGAGWQARLAQARTLKRRGELAAAWQIMQETRAAATAEAPIIYADQYNRLAMLLELPTVGFTSVPPRTALEQLHMCQLPERRALRQAGLTGAGFWKLGDLASGVMAMMVRAGRGRELIEYYDAAFPTPAALERYAVKNFSIDADRARAAVYLGHALSREDRHGEARQLLRNARRAIERRFSADGPKSVEDLLTAAAVYSEMGDAKRALDSLRRARANGWPYTATSTFDAFVAPLDEDPVFAAAMANPQFAAIIAEVKEKLKRQKRLVQDRMETSARHDRSETNDAAPDRLAA